jgi:uncharacterized membrane protein YhaH (DUF805 family)
MTLAQLLFNDEGVITRRQWWIGTSILVAFQLLADYLAGRYLLSSGLGRPSLLFLSIALLIPFYSVNAKRFRAIGSMPELALAGGVFPLLAILCDTFLHVPALNMALGLLILAVILWYLLDLGILPHQPVIDVDRGRV